MNYKRDPYVFSLASLGLFAFYGPTIDLVNIVATPGLRWVIAMITLIFVTVRGGLSGFVSTPFGKIMVVFNLLAYASGFWSATPTLSILKAFGLTLVVFGFGSLGYFTGSKTSIKSSLDSFGIILVLFFFAAVFGYSDSRRYVEVGTVQMYRGLASGSNMFGFMGAVLTPYFCWVYYQKKNRDYLKIVILLFAILILGNIYYSGSRGAILIIVSTLGGYFVIEKSSLRTSLIMGILFVVATGVIFQINYGKKGKSFLIKSGTYDEETELLASRKQTWADSVFYSDQSGILGIGYGSATGSKFDGRLVVTAENYGREKGSSILGIREELGILGQLGFIGIFLFTGKFIITTYKSSRRKENKVYCGILGGFFVGMFVHSFFESWWGSPGAPESIVFWLFIGILAGINSKEKIRARKPTRIRVRKKFSGKAGHGV